MPRAAGQTGHRLGALGLAVGVAISSLVAGTAAASAAPAGLTAAPAAAPAVAPAVPASTAAAGATSSLPPSGYRSVTTQRVLDTRSGLQGVRGAIGDGQTVSFPVVGVGEVPPTGVVAVVVDVTVLAPTATGCLTAFGTGDTNAGTGSVQYAAGQTTTVPMTVRVGRGGRISLAGSGGKADVLVDVTGYVTTSPGYAGYRPLPTKRVVDSRTGLGTPSALGPGQSARVKLTSVGGVPAHWSGGTGVTAVVVDLTAVRPTATGWLTVTSGDRSVDASSRTLSTTAGEITTVQVIATVSYSDGSVTITNSAGTTDVTADVTGYVTEQDPTSLVGGYVPVTTSRTYDTRTALGHPLAAGATASVPVLGKGGVPASGVSGVVLAVTAVTPTATGALTVFAHGDTNSRLRTVQFAAGRTTTSQVVAKVGTGGKVDVFNSAGSTGLAVDVTGYLTTDPAPVAGRSADLDTTAPGPVTGLKANATSRSTVLRWARPADPDYTGVVIRRATGTVAPATPTEGERINPATQTRADVGTSAGSTYSYSVFSADGNGNDAAPVSVTVTSPGPPPAIHPVRQVTATTTTSTVRLDWSDVDPGTAGFTIVRRAGGIDDDSPNSATDGVRVADLPATARSYTEAGLPQLSTAVYGVFAYDASHRYAESPVGCPEPDGCQYLVEAGTRTSLKGTTYGSIDSATLQGVSCASATSCTAVDATGRALTFNGSAWSAPVPVSGAGFTSVSCAAATACTAFDVQGRAWRRSGSAWTGPVKVLPADGTASVSCPTTTSCTALSADGSLSSWDGTSWTRASRVLVLDVPYDAARPTVSCTSATYCVAAGRVLTHTASGFGPPARADVPQGLPIVDCVSTTFCMSVGGGIDRTSSSSLVDGAWRDSKTVDGYNGTSFVTCASSAFCATSGPSLQLWGGSGWNQQQLGSPPRPIDDGSCPTTSFCMFVGYQGAVRLS